MTPIATQWLGTASRLPVGTMRQIWPKGKARPVG